MSVLVPQDPVKLTLDYLNGKYPWPVLLTKFRQDNTTARQVNIRQTGGTRDGITTDAALLVVDCYTSRSEETQRLAAYTWGLLLAAENETIDGIQIYQVEAAGGIAETPDPETQAHKATFTVRMFYKATVALI